MKLVSETGVGTIAAGVSKGKADGVLISGTTAAPAPPQASIKYAGVPWEIGLAETQQTLVLNDLRGRIRVQVDGGLKTGRDVVIGALLGADEFGFATAPLVAMGCILMRVCHLNTCPVGIATQDPELRERFAGEPEQRESATCSSSPRSCGEIMAKLGFRTVDEMIGQVGSARRRPGRDRATGRPRGLDFSTCASTSPTCRTRSTTANADAGARRNSRACSTNRSCSRLAARRSSAARAVEISMPIAEHHRTVGTILGSDRLARVRRGRPARRHDPLTLHGQRRAEPGAFCPKGMTLHGRSATPTTTVARGSPAARSSCACPRWLELRPGQNIITGNVLLYGATAAKPTSRAWRASASASATAAPTAVVEGVGDHGCEYMTGGCAVILGPTGRNFGAGMSGGIAYVLDEDGSFASRINPIDGRSTIRSTRRTSRRSSAWSAGTSVHPQREGGRRAAKVGDLRAEVREGLPEGLQAGADGSARGGERQWLIPAGF